MTYEQAFKDWEYLIKTYDEAYDMTGGYEDQRDLDKLLKKPTKTTAKNCLVNQIKYWFEVGIYIGNYGDHGVPEDAKTDHEVIAIARRHYINKFWFPEDEDS